MNIAISGITGLVGHALSKRLLNNDHAITGLVREDFKHDTSRLAEKLEGIDAVVHLAGAPILKRWTSKWKDVIYHSRVDTTALLVSAINSMTNPPKMLVSASAVHIYDMLEVHDEYSTAYDDGFLADVCNAWEREALRIDEKKTRLAIIRLGVVLSSSGGALKKMLVPFKLGVGGKISDGLQPMPFIHIEDLTRAIEWILSNNKKGIFNMVAPEMVSNVEFTKALASVLRRPAFMIVPEFALKILYGEGATVLTNGPKVVTKRLLEEGFEFEYSNLYSALQNLLKD